MRRGRPLLGGGEAVLEGGDLGHQVTLGEEGDVEIGLSLGRGVDRAPHAFNSIVFCG